MELTWLANFFHLIFERQQQRELLKFQFMIQMISTFTANDLNGIL